MAKPILVIRMDGTNIRFPDQANEIRESLMKCFDNEYHLFMVFGPKYEDTLFETYNADGIDPIDIEQLKKIVNEKI